MRFAEFRGIVNNVRNLAMAVSMMAAAGLYATSGYYWIPGNTENPWGLYSDLANWGIGDNKSYEPATKIPGAGDTFAIGVQNGGQNLQFYLNLGGGTYTVGGWTAASARPGPVRNFAVSNGTLNVTGTFSTHNDLVSVWQDGKIAISGTYNAGLYDTMANPHRLNVHAGGVFEVTGTFDLYQVKGMVDAGGSLRLAPTTTKSTGTSAQRSFIENYGDLTLDEGFYYKSCSSGTTGGLSITNFVGGTLTLGGEFSRNGCSLGMDFAMAGGVLNIVSDTTFGGDIPFAVADGVEIAVAENAVLDASSFDFAPDSAIAKTGTGVMALGPGKVPAALQVAQGGIQLAIMGAYDLSGLSFGADTTLRISTSVDMTEPAVHDQCAIIFDVNAFVVGAKLFSSSDAGWLEKVQAAAIAQFAAVGNVVKDGTAIYLYPKTDVNGFDASKATSLNDPAGWGGQMPAAGSDVVVFGDFSLPGWEEVVLDADIPAFRSITVAQGAALRVEGGIDLPRISMVGKTAIFFTAGADAYLTNGFAASASSAEALPLFEIATNATVHLPQFDYPRTKSSISFNNAAMSYDASDCFKFQNVDLRLYGTIKLPDAYKQWYPSISATDRYEIHHFSRVTFGYADQGETAFFAMTAVGGRVEIFDSSYQGDGNYSSLHFVNPAPGGIVKVVRPIELRDFAKTTSADTGANAGFLIGFNNPVSESFTMIASGNTVLDPSAGSGIAGGATVILREQAQIARASVRAPDWTLTFGFIFRDQGRLVMEDESVFSYPHILSTAASYGRNVQIDSAAENVIALKSGRIMLHEMWRTTGTPGEAWVSNGVWEVDKRFPARTGTVGYVYTNTPVFNGFSSVRVANGGALTVRGTDNLKSFTRSLEANGIKDFDFQWNRLAYLNIPVVGEGGLFVTNALTGAVAQYDTTLVVGGVGNTATGTASACSVSATGARAYLKFQDGANWAGTVVANGGASLVNTNASTEAGLPATATFGAMRFEGDFPIRLWKGEATTNDFLEITGDSTRTGAKAGLVGVGMAGYVPEEGVYFTVARCPRMAQPPPAARGWKVKLVDDPDDGTKCLVRLAFMPPGTCVILR